MKFPCYQENSLKDKSHCKRASLKIPRIRGTGLTKKNTLNNEGGVRVCGDAVLRYFWCGFAVIFILTRGIAVSKH